MLKRIIAWDLGATKCAAGLIEFDATTDALHCSKRIKVKLTNTTSLINLIEQIETGLNFSMSDADAICIGAAGHYTGEELLLEGIYPYRMQFAKVALERQWPAYAIVHDYAPIVCATFTDYMHAPDNIKRLNTCDVQPFGRRVALGIGTGLGLKDGVLLENGDFWLGRNEIGHIGITTPPKAELAHLQMHKELMQYLDAILPHDAEHPITYEKILSGKGTVRLHNFFYPNSPLEEPEAVGKKMRAGATPELVDAFAWYVGLFIGTVQLTFMPEGGMWITGGVTLNHLHLFDHPALFAGIHASPAYMAQRQHYPLGVMCNHEHALIGSGYYAAKRLL